MSDADSILATKTYFGLFRGTCVGNVDPQQMGRIQVLVPSIGLTPSTWAMPCLPVTGVQSGVFTVPAVGAGVWVEFEGGDPDYPVWVGGFYSPADVPSGARIVPPGVSGLTIQTQLGNSITVSDTPGPTGGILIKTTTGATISVSDVGITISNGKGAAITMIGPVVDVNAGALTVT